MRVKGTKYPIVETLPAEAMPVSQFAYNNKTSVSYVYLKFDRFKGGIASGGCNYNIVQWKGSNFIIPE